MRDSIKSVEVPWGVGVRKEPLGEPYGADIVMIHIEDRIIIHASLEEVANWLRGMPQHYHAWHPTDHISFKAGGQELKEGSTAHVIERIGGRFTLSFGFKVTSAESGRVRWRATFPHVLVNLHGVFSAEEQSDVTEFVASTYYGWPIPLVGRILDWVISSFFVSRSMVAEHMREEGEYMKSAIELHE